MTSVTEDTFDLVSDDPLLDEVLLKSLQSVSRKLVAITAAALLSRRSRFQLGLAEYRVLVLLSGNTLNRPSELADALGVSRPAVAQTLSRLEAGGFIVRRVDRSDRRSSRLSLTSKGARVVEDVLAARERHLRPALATLSSSQRRSLTRALQTLDSALNSHGAP